MSHAPPPLNLVRIALVGVGAGLLSGMFGVGGGILVVPGLVLLAGMDQRMAHGTSLAAVLPISVSSLFTYWAQANVDWPVALWLSIGAVAGAVLGTRLLHVVSHRALALGFSALLVVTAARLFSQSSGSGRAALSIASVVLLVGIGLATGTLAGLLGVGGGVVMVPAMMLALSLPPALAKGTSVAVIIPTSIMGTLRNRRSGNTDLRAAAVVGLGGVGFAVVGGWLSTVMSDRTSNVLFAALLVTVAARLLWQVRSESAAGSAEV